MEPELLASVDHWFRIIALNHGPLWSSIVFQEEGDLSLAQMRMERSARFPIDVVIDDWYLVNHTNGAHIADRESLEDDPNLLEEVALLIVPNLYRIRLLQLGAYYGQWPLAEQRRLQDPLLGLYLDTWAGAAEILRKLDLENSQSSGGDSSRFIRPCGLILEKASFASRFKGELGPHELPKFLRYCPLKEFSLIYGTVDGLQAAFASSYSTLQELSLQIILHSADELLSLVNSFGSFSKLTTLFLEISPVNGYRPILADLNVTTQTCITLKEVCKLGLRGVSSPLMFCPRLASAELDFSGETMGSGTSLVTFVDRHQASFADLVLSSPPQVTDGSVLAPQLAALKTLRCELPKGYLAAPLLGRFSVNALTDLTLILPRATLIGDIQGFLSTASSLRKLSVADIADGSVRSQAHAPLPSHRGLVFPRLETLESLCYLGDAILAAIFKAPLLRSIHLGGAFDGSHGELDMMVLRPKSHKPLRMGLIRFLVKHARSIQVLQLCGPCAFWPKYPQMSSSDWRSFSSIMRPVTFPSLVSLSICPGDHLGDFVKSAPSLTHLEIRAFDNETREFGHAGYSPFLHTETLILNSARKLQTCEQLSQFLNVRELQLRLDPKWHVMWDEFLFLRSLHVGELQGSEASGSVLFPQLEVLHLHFTAWFQEPGHRWEINLWDGPDMESDIPDSEKFYLQYIADAEKFLSKFTVDDDDLALTCASIPWPDVDSTSLDSYPDIRGEASKGIFSLLGGQDHRVMYGRMLHALQDIVRSRESHPEVKELRTLRITVSPRVEEDFAPPPSIREWFEERLELLDAPYPPDPDSDSEYVDSERGSEEDQEDEEEFKRLLAEEDAMS
ncbi:hypothetical protein DL93DRAFT_2203045 [Clavulina sp. PMI_390]|nr:hypothetical protein DL93DRAFT_2203045 [Clavulina sp. PMI_390]